MRKNVKRIFIWILLIAAVAVMPLFLGSAAVAGTDDAAGKAVAAVDPDYKPWAKPIIEVKGKNAETLIFCLQAGVGAGILGAGFGYLIIRKRKQKGNE